MKTGSIAKTAALLLVLSALPVALVWRREYSATSSMDASSEGKWNETPRTQVPGLRAPSAPPNGPVLSPSPAGADDLSLTPTPDEIAQAALKKGRTKALARIETECTRLRLSLPDLRPDQVALIKEALQQKAFADLDGIIAAFRSGAVATWVQTPNALSQEQKSALSAMVNIDPRKYALPVIDDELKAILTPEQFKTYARVSEARRVSEAEEAAADTLKFINRSFDLTAEQKDGIFQELAKHALERNQPPAAASAVEPFPEIGSREEARDRIIRAHLTPEQVVVFDQKRAAERESLKNEMMEYYGKPVTAGAASR